MAERENEARAWIEQLVELAARYAGSASERLAAERVAGWIRALGIRDVSILPVAGGVRPGLSLGVHTGMGAIGCFWGGFGGTLLATLAAWSFWQEFRHHRSLLARLIHPPASVDVIARAGPDAPAPRVILSAHLDTTQAG